MYARRGSLDGERAEEPTRRRPRAETPADVVVSLQQAGGNQAVTQMLGGSRAVLARYGVRVLMDAQAQAPVVTGIDVIGRPKLRLIPGGEGSHVTAWAVFADIVRRAIVGQQLDAATATMKQMLRDQRASLDGEWTGAKPGPVTAALAQADTALADLAAPLRGAKLSQLQEMIDAYLTLHNLRPGTAVMIGKAQAIGAGEPAHLSTLRQFEVNAQGNVGALRTAIFGLIDSRALGFIGNLRVASGMAPGVDPADGQRVGSAVLRGLKDLAAAYPRSYAAAITDANIVTAWLQSEGLPPSLPGAIPAAAAPGAARQGWSRTGESARTDVGKRNSLCQIVLAHETGMTVDDDEEPAEPLVGEVRFAGRPMTLTKHEQGHHTVAWKLEMLRLESLLVGMTLSEAAHNLVDVGQELLSELGVGLQWLAGEELDDDEEPFRQYSQLALDDARAVLDARLRSINPDGNDTMVILLAAQELANAWMNGVNVLPLGAADIGAPAKGRGEGTALARLREFEQRKAPATTKKRVRDDSYTPEAARDDFLRLLDTKAVSYLHVAAQSGLAYPADQDQRVIVIVRRFLRAARSAFPKALEHSGIDTNEGVLALINGLKTVVADIDDAVDAVFEQDVPDTGPDLDLGGGDEGDEDDDGELVNRRPLKVRIGVGPDGRYQIMN